MPRVFRIDQDKEMVHVRISNFHAIDKVQKRTNINTLSRYVLSEVIEPFCDIREDLDKDNIIGVTMTDIAQLLQEPSVRYILEEQLAERRELAAAAS